MRVVFTKFTRKAGYQNFAKSETFAPMLLQMQSQSLRSFNFSKSPMPTKIIKPSTLSASSAPFSIRARSSTTPPPPLISEQPTPNSLPPMPSLSVAVPPTMTARNLGLRPTPELGLLSHLFVLSMAFGRLGASMKKLSKVVSEEVPGTLFSLKLSSMELNDLTQQLSSLRHKISGVHIGKKDGDTTRSRSFRKKNPAS